MTEHLHEYTEKGLLLRIAQELTSIRKEVIKAVNYMHEAESEVPEKMRRFIMYAHDLHDVCYMYESRGHTPPRHVTQEMERVDDRLRQLLKVLHADGGAFEKIRREMASDPENRWDHSRLLSKPNGAANETRTSEQQLDWINEGRA